MKYRAIISDAWALTRKNKSLIWWFAFLPALLTSLVSMVYLGYQAAAFWTSPHINAHAVGTKSALALLLETGLSMIKAHPGLSTFLIVISAITAVAYLILPVFTQGSLIKMIARMRAGHEVSTWQGFSYGFDRFLQLFEYHLMIKTFSFVSVLTEVGFVIRNFGLEAFELFGWIFLLVLLVGLLLTLLFTYSEYYIVIERKGVFASILASGGLVLRQLHHTLFMLLLMVIISVRIIINVIVALLVPLLVIGPVFFFASFTLTVVGVIVGTIVGLISLYFAAYFLGVFHVFATAVWTFTFLELTKKDMEERGEGDHAAVAAGRGGGRLISSLKVVKNEKYEIENYKGHQPLQHP